MSSSTNGLPGLLPALDALSRADKLRIIQHLVVALAREEGVPLVETGSAYPVWTPLHAFEAATVLLKALEPSAC
jgi:hypothetical protein